MQIKEFDCITINPSPLIPIAERKEIDYIDTSSVTEGRLEKVQHLISDFPSRAQREVVANDILISSVRPNLRHNYYVKATEDGMIASSGFIHLRVNDTATIDSKFLYYYLTSPFYTKYYTAIADCSQSSYPSFNKDVIEDIVFPNISSKRQKRIAKVLSGLDDKIALNRKKIEKMEALAKTIYDYWFVQFDFPDANGRPYKSSGGKMVYNPILKREIPEGWEVKRLEDLCSRIQSGGTPSTKRKELYNGDVSWFTTQELRDAWLYDSQKRISNDAINNSAAKIFPEGTVLLAIYAAPTVGRLGILSIAAAFNQACCGFVARNNIPKEYLFLTLLTNRERLIRISDGTAQKNLSVQQMRDFREVVPMDEVLAKWASMASVIFNDLKCLGAENNRIATLRDFLLPLLMNGQVEIGE